MCAFIVKKKISGKEYYYLNENKRIKGKDGKTKVKTKTIAYLGKDKVKAEKKAKEIMKKNKKNICKSEKIQMKPKEISVEDLARFCKRKGFVYPSGEIYGGFAGFWDYGHLGVELKNNIKKQWWDFHVNQREDVVGIDGSIITHPKTWKASGHIDSFSDIFVVCKKCKKTGKIDENKIGKAKCEYCGGDFDESKSKEFKLMFETNVGESGKAYLRPETAQLIFTNFKSVYDNARLKLPCGIAQIGKAFRNEIAPRDFLFRSREFEQMEIEYFIKPNQKCNYEIPDEEVLIYSEEMQKKDKEPVSMKIGKAFENKIIKNKWHAYWLAEELRWFKFLGVDIKKFRIRQHLKDELSHYSTDTWDIEYKFPFGWKEIQGIADRGNYDLSQHEKFSNNKFKVFDEASKSKVLPCVVCEPSLGVERAFLVFMFDSFFYDEKRKNNILKLNPLLSPIKAAIFPIVKKEKFENFAEKVFNDLKKNFNVIYDRSGSIGRRYARNDEIGTPFCITVDDKSVKNKDITIRDRDTQKQVRVKVSELESVLRKLIQNKSDFLKYGEIIF